MIRSRELFKNHQKINYLRELTYQRKNSLSPDLIGQTDHRNIVNISMSQYLFLNIQRTYFVSTTFDHIY
ncbi:hypothetical protein BpHYR1_022411 [Brachionus plicatilis]|uniref:Uncharacterized protein n=1 Tax=Brachionus plicatilis TaxID=10195 RepID=A0A3M7QBK5_BRAPC|nr:hypothetical protein BpHYR1_022411 [Brachionus plicatilis]